MKKNNNRLWLLLAVAALSLTLFLGILASIRYMGDARMDAYISFRKLRPLHVSSALGWIFGAAIGIIRLALGENKPENGRKSNNRLLWLYTILGLAILLSYVLGYFGGREYWEFPPVFLAGILLVWFLFGRETLAGIPWRKTMPIYRWMWLTGVVFFAFTFLESLFWHIPAVQQQPVRELSLQWKSYGSLVGSWNMLVYGTAIWLGRRLNQTSDAVPASKTETAIYLLSLTNLMFNWSHHIYSAPVAGWLLQLGYYVSMTEILLLAKLLYDYRRPDAPGLTERLLQYANVWVVVNLLPAILISVPVLNYYTHGTYVTVAHAMGTTIGINTLILLAAISYYVPGNFFNVTDFRLLKGFHWSVGFFLGLLLVIGLRTGLLREQTAFHVLKAQHQPWLTLAFSFGMAAAVCLLVFCMRLFRNLKNSTVTTPPEAVHK